MSQGSFSRSTVLTPQTRHHAAARVGSQPAAPVQMTEISAARPCSLQEPASHAHAQGSGQHQRLPLTLDSLALPLADSLDAIASALQDEAKAQAVKQAGESACEGWQESKEQVQAIVAGWRADMREKLFLKWRLMTGEHAQHKRFGICTRHWAGANTGAVTHTHTHTDTRTHIQSPVCMLCKAD